MDSYKVILKPSVEKDFRKLSKVVLLRVFSAIENLAEEPFPPKVAKLEGTDKTYRIRIGDYRVVYEVETAGNQLRFCMFGIVVTYIEIYKVND